MRLRKELIEKMSQRIVKTLLDGDYIIWEDRPDQLESIVNQVITDDLMIEDRLNDEVKTLLEARTDEYQREMMDYGRVFQMVKQKLVRERGLIL